MTEVITDNLKPWYKRWWGILLAVGGFGLFVPWYIWQKPLWSNIKKLAIGGLSFLLWAAFLVAGSQQPNSQSTASEPSGTNSAAPTVSPSTQKKSISYQTVKKSGIPNGGYTQVVVISRDLVNEPDMKALGEKVRDDNKSDRNAFVYVYDDPNGAQLREVALSANATEAQQAKSAQHLVGTYTKNGNSGFNTFQICLNGRDSDCQTIKY